MDLEVTTPHAWSLAYRDWLLELAQEEADSGFERLSFMKSDIAMYFFDVTRTWSPRERLCLMRGSVKRLWLKNYNVGTVELDPVEQAACDAFDYPYNRRWSPNGGPGTAFTWTQAGITQVIAAHKLEAAKRVDRRQAGGYKLKRTALHRAVRAAMLERFGKPESVGGIWTYFTRYPGFIVETSVDYATRIAQFRYGHRVSEEKADGRRGSVLLNAAGVSALLGWPHSEWNFVTDEDVPATAALIARLSTEFVDAVPGIAAQARGYRGD